VFNPTPSLLSSNHRSWQPQRPLPRQFFIVSPKIKVLFLVTHVTKVMARIFGDVAPVFGEVLRDRELSERGGKGGGAEVNEAASDNE
jgi:hypothetical protein